MRKIKSILFILLLMTCILIPAQTQAASKIKINKTKETIYVGDTLVLKITGTNKAVSWSSSNKEIATVSKKGKVTAKAQGTVTITGSVGSKKYKCKVTVEYNVKEMISSSYNWIVDDIWNGSLCDIKWYTGYGTDSYGSEILDSEVKIKLKNLDKYMKDKDRYIIFYKYLSDKEYDKYEDIIDTWNILLEELDYMYDVVKSSDIKPNIELDYKYEDKFGFQLFDFMDLVSDLINQIKNKPIK